MKKVIVTLAILALAVVAMTGCGKKKERMKLFLPGEYLGENVIKDLEKIEVAVFLQDRSGLTIVFHGQVPELVLSSVVREKSGEFRLEFFRIGNRSDAVF